MQQVNPQAPPKPCDFFDLIGGTSTGGLIAIMLGRLRMDITSCIDAYVGMSEAIFKPKKWKINLFGKAKDFVFVKGKFDSDILADQIKTVVGECPGETAHSKLREKEPKCKV